MGNSNISSVVLFGTGNVGSHLAKALINSGIELKQIYSRNPTHAEELATKKGVPPIWNLKEADTSADLWLISVSDDAISPIAESLPEYNGIVAHTAGSIPIDILARFSKRGVFYPFQTLSKNREIDYNEVPLLVEGSDADTVNKLLRLARILSVNVREADSSQRATLHIAAVFSCNFVNHLYTLSADLLEAGGLSFKYLVPLIKETTRKILHMSPRDAQTGPAIRDDKAVMQKHIEQLTGNTSLQEIYRLLSNDILQYHKQK
jgi:predicted short-subunit dehydrogenase-like oxidoreductase (DUF2520 family)